MKKLLRMQGIYTVEAVFITPIFLFLFLLIFYMCFYMRDKCTVQAAADLASEKGSLLMDGGGDMGTGKLEMENQELMLNIDKRSRNEKAVEKEIRRLLEGNLFIIKLNTILVSINSDKIHCLIKGDTRISLFNIKTVFQRELGRLELDSQASARTSIDFVRKITAFVNKTS